MGGDLASTSSLGVSRAAGSTELQPGDREAPRAVALRAVVSAGSCPKRPTTQTCSAFARSARRARLERLEEREWW